MHWTNGSAPIEVEFQTAIEHKPRLVVLDGLRGVAAVCVAFYHVLQTFGGRAFLAHAVQAVDFFFILSGFVLTHAYAERIRDGRISFRLFTALRIVRLYPMIVLGAILGSLSIFEPSGMNEAVRSLLPTLTAIPFPQGTVLGFSNPPEWSLFFEMIASLALFPATRLKQ